MVFFAPIVAKIGLQVASDPATKKTALITIIAVPVAILMVFSLLVSAISSSTSSIDSSTVQQAIEEYCTNAANAPQSIGGSGTFDSASAGEGSKWLLKFLYDQKLTFYQARILWAVAMRESGATNYTSDTPGFNGVAYGMWQFHVDNSKEITRISGRIEPGAAWTMNDIGADPIKSYALVMWFSKKVKDMTTWGLAPNQPYNGAVFNWVRYSQWTEKEKQDSGAKYIEFYNKFPDAARQAGLSFPGGLISATSVMYPTGYTSANVPQNYADARKSASASPSPTPSSTGTKPKPTLGPSVAPSFLAGATRSGLNSLTGQYGVWTTGANGTDTFTPVPNKKWISDTIQILGPNGESSLMGTWKVLDDATYLWVPFAGIPTTPSTRSKASSGTVVTTTQQLSVPAAVRTYDDKTQRLIDMGVTLTVEGNTVVPPGDPVLQTFQVAGRSWTVHRDYVPTFRAFLADWEANPYLGGGRFSLSNAPNGTLGSYNYRPANGNADRWSDHGGYAVDIRTDILLADRKMHMTPQERQAVKIILAKYPELGWGGDYSAGWQDEMHVYIRGGSNPADITLRYLPTFIISDGNIDSALKENGEIEQAMNKWPYTADSAAGRSIEEGIQVLDTNVNADSAAVWIVNLGTKEAHIGEPEEGTASASPTPTPSATEPPKLLDPEKMKSLVVKMMNLTGTQKRVVWVLTSYPGPSRDIEKQVLSEIPAQYRSNLSVIEVPQEPRYMDDKGNLTPAGDKYVADAIAGKVFDAQPTIMSKAECQELMFGAMGQNAVLSGDFVDRTDYVIPGGAEAAAKIGGWLGTQGPCGNCYRQCDHLAAIAWSSPTGTSGYQSAATHWQRVLTGGGKWGEAHVGDKAIPIGALVFFKASASGHVATYVGGGWVVSNWGVPTGGETVQKVPLQKMADAYGYLGWATPVFPGPE